MGRLCLTAVTAKQCLSSVFDRFRPHTSPLALPLSSIPSHASHLAPRSPPALSGTVHLHSTVPVVTAAHGEGGFQRWPRLHRAQSAGPYHEHHLHTSLSCTRGSDCN